jgi:L-rhamnose isomerase
VVLFDDETKEMAKEIVRCNALDRVDMALDYFDASINRISAWTVGFRSWQKALLSALCTPHEEFKSLQDASNWTELMVRQEEQKTMPFGDVWDEYCQQCGTTGDGWFEEVKKYEAEVLSRRK